MPNDWSNNDYMQMMNLSKQYEPMMQMPQEELESMFPRSYYIIHPHVSRHCDMLISKYGTMHTPSRQQLDDIVDDIDDRVGQDIDAEYRDDDDNENLESYHHHKDNDYQDVQSFQYGKEKGERQFDFEDERQFGFGGGFHHGRRRFRRDLISIILLRELLSRRRRPHHFGFGFPGQFGF